MKIGIVTCQYSNNFGAVLQAYGLKTVLEKMGHQVFYLRNCTDKYARGLFFRIRPYGKEYHELPVFIRKNYRGWKQWKTFQSVRKEFHMIEHYEDEALDCVILGSDEIWNATNPLFQQPIFFGAGMEMVMSYATSIGNATDEDMKKIPTEYFKHISPVLVRDSATKTYMDSIGIRNERVCDPTILADLDTFKHPCNNPLIKQEPYLLVYAYGHYETQEIKDAICAFAKQKKLKVFSVCFPLDWCDETIYCSPLEFCAVMECASYVYTSTFHGSIFAILNQKQFISLPYSIKTIDLLQSLGLENRLVNLENCNVKTIEQKFLDELIDYDSVNATLQLQRTQSMQLLQEGLKTKKSEENREGMS